jgi:hypothetical protein
MAEAEAHVLHVYNKNTASFETKNAKSWKQHKIPALFKSKFMDRCISDSTNQNSKWASASSTN